MTSRSLLVVAFGLVVAALLISQQGQAVGSEQPAQPSATANRIVLTPAEAQDAAARKLLPEDTRSVLRIDQKIRYGQFVWDERGAPSGDLLIRVDLNKQLLSIYRGGHEIGVAIVLYGADGHDTPLGRFSILEKVADHHSRTYDAPMPYSLRLTADWVAIHGSKVRRGRATHGCVGVPLEFAQKVFEAADVGDAVEIVAT